MAKEIKAWKSTNGMIYESKEEAEKIENEDRIEQELEELVKEYIRNVSPRFDDDDAEDIVCLIIDNRYKINKIFGE